MPTNSMAFMRGIGVSTRLPRRHNLQSARPLSLPRFPKIGSCQTRSIVVGLTGHLGRNPYRAVKYAKNLDGQEKKVGAKCAGLSRPPTQRVALSKSLALGSTVKPVADLEAQFEAAALWFRLDKRRPKRQPVNSMRSDSGREERTPPAEEPWH
jgi:hypothetical protein